MMATLAECFLGCRSADSAASRAAREGLMFLRGCVLEWCAGFSGFGGGIEVRADVGELGGGIVSGGMIS
jgi:hypothetical protein